MFLFKVPQVRPRVLTPTRSHGLLSCSLGRTLGLLAAAPLSSPDTGGGFERVFLSLSFGEACGDIGRPGGEVPRDGRRCVTFFMRVGLCSATGSGMEVGVAGGKMVVVWEGGGGRGQGGGGGGLVELFFLTIQPFLNCTHVVS